MALNLVELLLTLGQMIVYLFNDWAVLLCFLFVLVQTVGYAILITTLASLRQKTGSLQRRLPTNKLLSFSIVIPAYNEEKNIEKKLENTFGLRYPRDLFEVIVVDDGSTDNTPEILALMKEKYSSNLKVLRQERGGKSAADDLGLKNSVGEIVVISDADTFLNSEALYCAADDFADSSVGGVTCHVRSVCDQGETEVISLNKKIAFYLRKKENELGSVPGMSGPFAAFRRKLVGHFDSGVYACDMDIAFLVWKSEHRVVYDERIVGYTWPHGRDYRSLVRYVKHTFKGAISMFLRHHDALYSRKQGLLSNVVALQYQVLPLLTPLVFVFLMLYTLWKMFFSPYALIFYGMISLFFVLYFFAKTVAASSVVTRVFDLVLVRAVTYVACLRVYFDYIRDKRGIWDTH